jgi:hypothetical protein
MLTIARTLDIPTESSKVNIPSDARSHLLAIKTPQYNMQNLSDGNMLIIVMSIDNFC